MNLYDAIFSSERGDRVAILYEGRQLTYNDLQGLTNQFSRVLKELRIAPGERVAILLHDSPEFIASFISICSLGAIAVPVNMGLRLDAQEQILSDCTASKAVVEPDFCNRISTDAWEKLRHLKDLIVVERDAAKSELSCTPPEDPRVRIHKLDELVQRVEGEGAPAFPVCGANETAFILYTSGSTGEPKGAMHRISDIFYTNRAFCRQVLKLRDGDRVFSSSRLPFAYGLGNAFTFPLLNGVTTILCREKPAPEVIDRILRELRPTILFAVPVVYSLLLEHHHRLAPLECSSLRLCVSAGEALPARLGEDWETCFGVEVLDGIGSTEMMHMWMSNLEGEVRYGSSGKLLDGYDAKLLDPEGNPVNGREGNLWVRGESAALGYWQRPDVTARTFVDGWVRTGDIYRCDEDGYWYHMGRSDDCFKSSGQWVSPVEVEDVLMRNSSLSRVAVVEDFDEHGLPCVAAFVIKGILESDSGPIEEELRDQCRQLLPRYKQPRRYIFVDRLPYTATGKIQRFKLRENLRSEI